MWLTDDVVLHDLIPLPVLVEEGANDITSKESNNVEIFRPRLLPAEKLANLVKM